MLIWFIAGIGLLVALVAWSMFRQVIGLAKLIALAVAGSFVGGVGANVIAGNGFELEPAGLSGTLVGAVALVALGVIRDLNKARRRRKKRRR
ncbi:MAG: GlsB/YeaQ/YmgE family stress response membrane protein [Actinomycetota bacterium]|nr:GlsB/YeaQ/YmgE family stress response membrane protein [Actinomycetota bacterium]